MYYNKHLWKLKKIWLFYSIMFIVNYLVITFTTSPPNLKTKNLYNQNLAIPSLHVGKIYVKYF